MSEHLPECPLLEPCDDEVAEHGYCSMQRGVFCIHCHQWCACDRLRACEDRIKTPLLAIIKAGGKAYAEGWEWGRAEALDEARNEAALAMSAIDTYLPPDEHNHVLAAIDALRETSDD